MPGMATAPGEREPALEEWLDLVNPGLAEQLAPSFAAAGFGTVGRLSAPSTGATLRWLARLDSLGDSVPAPILHRLEDAISLLPPPPATRQGDGDLRPLWLSRAPKGVRALQTI